MFFVFFSREFSQGEIIRNLFKKIWNRNINTILHIINFLIFQYKVKRFADYEHWLKVKGKNSNSHSIFHCSCRAKFYMKPIIIIFTDSAESTVKILFFLEQSL